MQSPSEQSTPSVQAKPEGGYCLLGQDSVQLWYAGLLEAGVLQPDDNQRRVVDSLQNLSNRLADAAQQHSEGLLSRLLPAKRSDDSCRGIYIHGSVGRGKSFLMDGFFLNLPKADKLRVHFHGFMKHFHADMKRLEGDPDPLHTVGSRLADKYKLICFDEFHVRDIADAMILGRLLEIFVDKGVAMVMTSNYKPDDLYLNGLARDRFLPAIELLKSRFEICSLDGDIDYRLRTLSKAKVFLAPHSAENEQRFADMFDQLALGIELTGSVRVGSRRMTALRRTSDAVWFDFKEICAGNFNQADYLQIAERFAAVFLSHVPKLGTEALAEASRRFTWLIDVLYDSRIKLAMLAEHELADLYEGEGGESGRTLSRLIEMQSQQYLENQMRTPQELLAS